MGYDECFVDSYGNVIGYIKGKKIGKRILFDGYVDIVLVLDDFKWIYLFFGVEIIDGKIYGRGIFDMKG